MPALSCYFKIYNIIQKVDFISTSPAIIIVRHCWLKWDHHFFEFLSFAAGLWNTYPPKYFQTWISLLVNTNRSEKRLFSVFLCITFSSCFESSNDTTVCIICHFSLYYFIGCKIMKKNYKKYYQIAI